MVRVTIHLAGSPQALTYTTDVDRGAVERGFDDLYESGALVFKIHSQMPRGMTFVAVSQIQVIKVEEVRG